MTTSNAPATQENNGAEAPAIRTKDITDSVLAKVNSFVETGDIHLPEDYSAENALRAAFLILSDKEDSNNQKVLFSCSNESIANSLLQMVIEGLSPLKNQCYFIPYGNQLTYHRSYLGSKALAIRQSNVVDVVAQAIFEKDVFVYTIDNETGMKKLLKHEQSIENIDVTKVKGAYAVVTCEDGNGETYSFLEVMNLEQIKKAWNMRRGNGLTKAHTDFTDEMAKKTVIQRACKPFLGGSNDADLDILRIPRDPNKEQVETEDVGFEEVKEDKPPVKKKPARKPTKKPTAKKKEVEDAVVEDNGQTQAPFA